MENKLTVLHHPEAKFYDFAAPGTANVPSGESPGGASPQAFGAGPTDLATLGARVRERETLIVSLKQKTLDQAEEALREVFRQGADLMEAKALLPHGQWGSWLKEYFPNSADTAQTYMRLAANPDRARLQGAGSVRQALRLLKAMPGEQGDPAPNALRALKPAPWIDPLGRLVRFVKKNPLDQWPVEAREKLKADLQPIVAILFPMATEPIPVKSDQAKPGPIVPITKRPFLRILPAFADSGRAGFVLRTIGAPEFILVAGLSLALATCAWQWHASHQKVITLLEENAALVETDASNQALLKKGAEEMDRAGAKVLAQSIELKADKALMQKSAEQLAVLATFWAEAHLTNSGAGPYYGGHYSNGLSLTTNNLTLH